MPQEGKKFKHVDNVWREIMDSVKTSPKCQSVAKIDQILEIGKGKIIKEGKKVAILSFGARLQESLKAASALEAKGVSTTVDIRRDM